MRSRGREEQSDRTSQLYRSGFLRERKLDDHIREQEPKGRWQIDPE